MSQIINPVEVVRLLLKQTELAVHVGPEPDIIDPALNSAVDGATILVHTFEGLMTLDEDGVPIYGSRDLPLVRMN